MTDDQKFAKIMHAHVFKNRQNWIDRLNSQFGGSADPGLIGGTVMWVIQRSALDYAGTLFLAGDSHGLEQLRKLNISREGNNFFNQVMIRPWKFKPETQLTADKIVDEAIRLFKITAKGV